MAPASTTGILRQVATYTLAHLLNTLPQEGEVLWIGLRRARKAPMQSVSEVDVSTETGLDGDRYRSTSGKRQVTLVQAEHLAVVGNLLGRDPVPAELLRRNVVVRGINLLALRDRDVMIGPVTLRVTGLCHPCSRMEAILGPGGYNALRGHGGVTARVVSGGRFSVGDTVRLSPSPV